MASLKDRKEEKHFSNQGGKCEIIEYFGNKNCTVQFDDGTIVKNLQYNDIKKGDIKNPNIKCIFNVGFIGQGKYTSTIKGKKTKYYDCWHRMLTRGYDTKFKQKYPTYKDVTVCEKWHNFQNFARWYEENYNPQIMQGWALDKDILVKGNKIYSPETCAFVPIELNLLLIINKARRGDYPIGVFISNGRFRSSLAINKIQKHLGYFDTSEEAFQVYKIAKEGYIKQKADEWKDLIDPNIYQAMYNYKVEITD